MILNESASRLSDKNYLVKAIRESHFYSEQRLKVYNFLSVVVMSIPWKTFKILRFIISSMQDHFKINYFFSSEFVRFSTNLYSVSSGVDIHALRK
jgi:hypothetical protein